MKFDYKAIADAAIADVEAQKPCAEVDALIIDVNNLLYRFAHIESQNVDRCVIAVVEKILFMPEWYGAKLENTHVVWEGNSKQNWRFLLHPEYKGTRKAASDDTLRACVRAVEKRVRCILAETRVKQWDPVDAEGDDGFGTLALSLLSDHQRVGIYSTDRDLLQLVSDEGVLLIVPQRGASDIAMSEADVRRKYGISPRQIQDVKALEGDVGDNIPGVKGFGKKYATTLVNSFGGFWPIIKSLDSGAFERKSDETKKAWNERLKAAGLTESKLEKLKAGRESAIMSYEIGGIRTDVGMEESEQDKTSEARFFEDFPEMKHSSWIVKNAGKYLNL